MRLDIEADGSLSAITLPAGYAHGQIRQAAALTPDEAVDVYKRQVQGRAGEKGVDARRMAKHLLQRMNPGTVIPGFTLFNRICNFLKAGLADISLWGFYKFFAIMAEYAIFFLNRFKN